MVGGALGAMMLPTMVAPAAMTASQWLCRTATTAIDTAPPLTPCSAAH